MGMPSAATINGTGSFVYFTDWTISPFQVGVGVVFSGGTGTATVDVTFDRIDVGGLGTTAANATWWTVVALTSANASANYTTPVQAMRVNVVTAVATTVVVATFVQAGLPR